MKRSQRKAELILKTKADLKNGSDNIKKSSLDYGLKLDVKGQEGGRVLDVDEQGGRVGGLENWTIFMDVICVSSHIRRQ